MREFGHVFNDEYLKFGDGTGDTDMADSSTGDSSLRLLAIPTNQRARADLVAVGDHIEQEKDRLLNVVSNITLMHLLQPLISSLCTNIACTTMFVSL